MGNKNNKDVGLVNSSGICIDGDILLQCEHEHTTKSYLILRILLAFVCVLSTMSMADSFTGGNVLATVILFHSMVSVVAVSLFKSKYSILKCCSLIMTGIYVGILFIERKYVKNGFFIAVSNYMRLANISPGSWDSNIENGMRAEPYCMFFFFMALTLVIALGLTIACVYRIDFPLMFIFTFPIFEVGMYQGMECGTLAVVGLIVSWITLLAMHIINHTTNKAGRKNTFAVHERSKTFFFTSHNAKAAFYPVFMTFVSLITAVVFIIIILVSMLFGYKRPESFDSLRYNMHNALTNFDVSNLDDFFSDLDGGSVLYGVTTVGGTNGGNLGVSNGISFNGSTALKIKTPKLYSTMYLKGYVAGKYENNSWTAYPSDKSSDDFTGKFDKLGIWPQDYTYKVLDTVKSEATSIASIDVTVRSASPKFVYAPYATEYSEAGKAYGDEMYPFNDSYIKIKSSKKEYTLKYYTTDVIGGQSEWPMKAEFLDSNSQFFEYDDKTSSAMKAYSNYVTQTYMETADIESLKNVYNDIVNNYFDGNADGHSFSEIYQVIKYYFDEEGYKYNLQPGSTPNGEDFIDYFLTVQKEGYCTYFATVGVELMRMFGYPSRYVEGYMILPSQQDESPDSSGRYTAIVPDKCAHAWAEVFIENVGWVPAEFTPGYDDDNPNLSENEKKIQTQTTTVTTTAVINTDTSSVPDSQNDGTQTTAPAPSNNTSEKNSSNGNNGTGTSYTSDDSSSTAATTKKVGAVSSINGPENEQASAAAKSILLIIVGLVFAVGVIAANRKHKLHIMEQKCTQTDLNKRVIEIFRYTLKYLALLGVKSDKNLSDMQLCDVLLEICHTKHINELDEQLKTICSIAVKAQMSAAGVSEEDAENAEKILKFIADEVVKTNLSQFDMISAKYVYCLY